jgi:hypothetical protein
MLLKPACAAPVHAATAYLNCPCACCYSPPELSLCMLLQPPVPVPQRCACPHSGTAWTAAAGCHALEGTTALSGQQRQPAQHTTAQHTRSTPQHTTACAQQDQHSGMSTAWIVTPQPHLVWYVNCKSPGKNASSPPLHPNLGVPCPKPPIPHCNLCCCCCCGCCCGSCCLLTFKHNPELQPASQH